MAGTCGIGVGARRALSAVAVGALLAAPASAGASVTAETQTGNTVIARDGGLTDTKLSVVGMRDGARIAGERRSEHVFVLDRGNGSSSRAALGELSGRLLAVAGTSARSVWAVGDLFSGRRSGDTLIMRWNGRKWRQVPSPNVGGDNSTTLTGVAATSAKDAWAVGSTSPTDEFPTPRTTTTVILHWNGRVWRRMPSPDPPSDPQVMDLNGVAATSANDAWAVGTGPGTALIFHWNGHAWLQVPAPSTKGPVRGLWSVTATSATDAWAVGDEGGFVGSETMFLHWDGKSWRLLPGPTPTGRGYVLYQVAATSPHNAWAVGYENVGTNGASRTVILHSDGKTWKRVPSPNPGTRNILRDVQAISAGNVVALGSAGNGGLVVRWNGSAWKQLRGPSQKSRGMSAFTFVSARHAWLVGSVRRRSLITVPSMLSWNGSRFRRYIG